jgi:hypothetical protein
MGGTVRTCVVIIEAVLRISLTCHVLLGSDVLRGPTEWCAAEPRVHSFDKLQQAPRCPPQPGWPAPL